MDKPHIITIAIQPDSRVFIDFVHKGDRRMGYYVFSDIFTQIEHQQIVEAVLEVCGISKTLSLKEKIAMFDLIGTE